MLASASIRQAVREEVPLDMPPPQYSKLVPLHQHPGAKPLDGSRAPSLIERASKACGEIIGPTYGELVYTVLEGIKRGQIGKYSGRLLLERCCRRPAHARALPVIDCAQDLVEADRRLMAAANVGADLAPGVAHGAGVHPDSPGRSGSRRGWRSRELVAGP